MITQKYITFFKGLEKNNNLEWFHGHKKEYEKDVKGPFLTLLENLIPEIEKLEPMISSNPKDALFRINRDVRFSKDKTPYNTLLKAGFSPGGKKSKLPGFYLGISAEKVHVGGGLFTINGPDLKSIRTLISENTEEFTQIVNSEAFITTFQDLKGEQARRLDKSLQPILEKTSYIANKQFYAMQELPVTDHLNADKMLTTITRAFEAIHPLNQFLKKAF